MAPPAMDPPAGVRLVTLAERPDLVAGVYAVAVEAFPDIPTIDELIAVGTSRRSSPEMSTATGSRRTRSSSRWTRPRARWSAMRA